MRSLPEILGRLPSEHIPLGYCRRCGCPIYPFHRFHPAENKPGLVGTYQCPECDLNEFPCGLLEEPPLFSNLRMLIFAVRFYFRVLKEAISKLPMMNP